MACEISHTAHCSFGQREREDEVLWPKEGGPCAPDLRPTVVCSTVHCTGVFSQMKYTTESTTRLYLL